MIATNSEHPKSHCKPELGKEKPRGTDPVRVQWGPRNSEEAYEDFKQGKLTPKMLGTRERTQACQRQFCILKICLYIQRIDAKMQIFANMANS